MPEIGVFDAGQLAEFRNRYLATLIIEVDVTGHISRLLLWRSPAAILRPVGSTRVDAVKARRSRSFAHVGNKILEPKPTRADRDAFRAVATKVLHVRIAATVQHPLPNAIATGLRLSVSYSHKVYQIKEAAPSLARPPGLGYIDQATDAMADHWFFGSSKMLPPARSISIDSSYENESS